MFEWGNDTIDERLLQELLYSADDLSSTSEQIEGITRQVASQSLINALNGDNSHRSEYALRICLDLRNQFRDGEWPDVLAVLEDAGTSDTGRKQVLAQLVFAACVPDKSEAVRVLKSIDLNQTTESVLLGMMKTIDERELDVTEDFQVDLAAEYFMKNQPLRHAHRLAGADRRSLSQVGWG